MEGSITLDSVQSAGDSREEEEKKKKKKKKNWGGGEKSQTPKRTDHTKRENRSVPNSLLHSRTWGDRTSAWSKL